jgi:hypothetical protein
MSLMSRNLTEELVYETLASFEIGEDMIEEEL